jgi:hypothetical protein
MHFDFIIVLHHFKMQLVGHKNFKRCHIRISDWQCIVKRVVNKNYRLCIIGKYSKNYKNRVKIYH